MDTLNESRQAGGRLSGQKAGDLHAAIPLSISCLAERLLMSNSVDMAAETERSKASFLAAE